MSNVMSLKKLKNRVSRNGFDLSAKNVFSAKIGELLPVSCIECIPGDKFKVNIKNFTRTMPVNTAAYTRIREYFDFFFVPYELMWNKFNPFVTQMYDENPHAASASASVKLTEQHPYFTVNSFKNWSDLVHTNRNGYNVNIFGFERVPLSCKLLNYLDYGRFVFDKASGSFTTSPAQNVALNPFPLLAYQHIYNDYFRNSQWEKCFAPAFNIDYVRGDNDLDLDPHANMPVANMSMFDLRYCNWNKDYFMGVLPNSQYGDAASIIPPVPDDGLRVGNTVFNADSISSGTAIDYQQLRTFQWSGKDYFVLQDKIGNTYRDAKVQFSKEDLAKLNSGFTILALRQAEALQRWKEITQSNSKDYKNQIEAHFNVTLDDSYSDRCRYLGGSVNTIDISEVVNNNITGNSAAEIAGKGVGVGNGDISFSTDVHGIFMCIYHAVPLLDYAITGIKRMNLKTKVTDYAIPELDAVGMTSVNGIELISESQDSLSKIPLLGFAPRYYEYKTDYDKVHGAFVTGGLDSWVAPVDSTYIKKYVDSLTAYGYAGVGTTNVFFKVNPATLNPIFAQDVDDDVTTDQLLVNSSFDIKAVRNLDYNGLPY